MIILPAIDIRKGQCVCLTKGDFATTERISDDALEMAESFKASGSKWIHMVDLDGALDGDTINSKTIIEVAAQTGLNVEVGGGIRNMEAISFYLEKGIKRVVLGSIAITDPQLTKKAAAEYGDKIIVGIDARNEIVSGSGWTKDSDIHYIEMAKRMEDIGINTIIYTDISRDGTLQGPNVEQLKRIHEAVGCDIIASGGIRSLEDIKMLKAMELYGAICGKSIYKGTLSLEEAIRCCQE